MSFTLKKNMKKAKLQRKIAGEEDSFPQLPSSAEKIDNALLLNVAIKHAALTGSFFDTKFYVFSRRKKNGLVYAPKAVYANGWILRTRLPSYFEQLLSDTFGDCVVGDLADGFPSSREEHTDDYDYNEDSDLEDDEDDISDVEMASSVGTTSKKSPKEGMSGFDLGTDPTSDSSDSSTLNAEAAYTSTKMLGRIVVLPHTAFATWTALVFYLYTGEVAFKRLRSQANTPVSPPAKPSTGSQSKAGTPPTCSPKSMYRLADMLGLDELKEKAKKDILSKLTVENVFEELMSSFTSAYEEIRDAEIQLVYGNPTYKKAVVGHLTEWIDELVTGDLPHTKNVFVSLIQRLTT